MRIKHNLIIAMLFFSLVPIFLLGNFYKSKLTASETKAVKNKIESTVQIQNQVLNTYFEDIIIKVRDVSSQAFIKDYLVDVNSGVITEENNKSNAEVSLLSLSSANSTIDNVCLLDADDNIIYTTEKYYEESSINQLIENFDEDGNGFSNIFVSSDKAQPSTAFAYIKEIFDLDDNKLGTLVMVYNTSTIQNIDKNSKIFKTAHIFCVDHSGNVMEFPYTFVSNFENFKKYNNASKFINSVINNEKGSTNQFLTYKADNTDMVMYSSRVTSSGWSIFMIIKQDEYASGISSAKLTINVFTIVLTLIMIIIGTFLANNFTKPITEMLDTLHRKQRGDKFAKFQISTTNNEFFEISEAFNAMIDDISDSEQRYRTVVEMSENIIFEYNIKKNIVRFSDNFNAKFSFRSKSEKYEDSFFVNCSTHMEDKSAYIKLLNGAFRKANYMQGEFRFKNIYGDYVWFLMRATMLYGRDETPFKVIGVMVDIDRAKTNELRLLQRANYDALTKLFNRETFEKRLFNAFELSSMRKERDAVLFIDLDDFKHFNDDYGHACGDEVLKFVANSILKLVEKCGFAGRYGGDEFVICLSAQNSEEEAGEFARNLILELQKGFYSQVVNSHLSLNCSIGISFFSQSGNNIDTIIEEADEAMYTVKKRGKSNFAIYKKP